MIEQIRSNAGHVSFSFGCIGYYAYYTFGPVCQQGKEVYCVVGQPIV